MADSCFRKINMTNLETIAKAIRESNQPQVVTPRQLINAVGYERRSPNACRIIDEFLEENDLEVVPHYLNEWVDNDVEVRPKEKATKRLREDPIKRLGLLKAANTKPTSVDNSDPLQKAVTLMMLNNYSQLPVMKGPRTIVGYISWETIGEAISKGEASELVKDYKRETVRTLKRDTPLLRAIYEVYKHDFIVVTGEDGTPCGIVTTADISSQFLTWTEPFVMLEQIENLIRHILDGKILKEDLEKVCQEESRKPESIDDLTFGEYIALMENPKQWERIGLKSVDRALFVQSLNEVREIRNDIMHFDPEGIDDSSRGKLKAMGDYLTKLANLSTKTIV